MPVRVGERGLSLVRKIALALPEVNERTSHGARCYFIRYQRPLCYFHDDHRDDGRISCGVPSRSERALALMVERASSRVAFGSPLAEHTRPVLLADLSQIVAPIVFGSDPTVADAASGEARLRRLPSLIGYRKQVYAISGWSSRRWLHRLNLPCSS